MSGLSGGMMHAMGDCTPENHCGCLDVATDPTRAAMHEAVLSRLTHDARRRGANCRYRPGEQGCTCGASAQADRVLGALSPVLEPLEALADLVRREHVPATVDTGSGAVTYCQGCGALLDEEPCPYLAVLGREAP